ncbi:MAG TPA: rod shape-determining protein MreD [Acidimicrobiia bacterium]|jgi:rod shape-determining protein MreD|nr:rod shape-determining protein MreD [Acidimicrobiia bacterium]
MTGRLRIVAVLLTAMMAQVTVFEEIRIDGVSVELLLLVSILAGFHGGPERGAVVAFCAGLLHDSITATPMGLHALVYAPLAVATSHLEVRLARSTRPFLAVGLVVAMAVGVCATMLAGGLFGLHDVDVARLARTALVASLMSVAVAVPTSRAVCWAVTGGLPVDVDVRGSGVESRG